MSQTPQGYRALSTSNRQVRAGAKRTGAADPNEVFTVSVRVRRRPGAPALPDLAQLPTGARPFLSREEFAAQYGASQGDLEAIAKFAAANGLAVVESSIARRTVVLKGTSAQMSKAFAVDLGIYQTSDETYRGREGAVQVPEAIAPIVEGVFGLDNRQMARPQLVKSVPKAANSTPAQGLSPLTPPQVGKLYNFPTSPNASGQTIAIFEFGGGYKLTDVQLFYKSIGLPVPAITAVSVNGAVNSPGTDSYTTETLLDIAVAGSVASGAKLAVYFAPWTEQGWLDIVTTAVHDAVNKPSVISISYGWPELDTFGALTWSLQTIQAVTATFQEAAALGVTIFVSSGDNGSGCGVGNGKAHVLYPGSDPGVTCVGGTSLSNVSGASFTEHVWNDNGITGGGISDIFCPPHYAPPVWQGWAGVQGSVNDGHKGRGVPDVAGNADPDSGYVLYQNGASIGSIGGTSAAAPLYAGLAALLNAGLGEPLGFLNVNLYAAPFASAYRDINDGQSNASGGAPGYKSGPGWDACTGLGSVIGTGLEAALNGFGLPIAVQAFNNKLYMVWKGIERDDRVFFSSFNGSAWTPQQQVPNILSSSGVSLAVFAGKLYMAWKGTLGDQGIYFTHFDGATWAPQQLVAGIGTSVGPSLTVLGNTLFMAWKGVEQDQRIFFNQFNGSTWTAQQLVPGVGTSVAPSVMNFNGVVYMMWKGQNADQRLYWSKFNGTGFAPQQVMVGATSEGASLSVFNNSLYAVWKGVAGDQSMWFANCNGSAWSAQRQIPGIASSVGGGSAVFNGALYACWKGELGDQGLYFSHFNGSVWAAQTRVPFGGTSPELLVGELVGV